MQAMVSMECAELSHVRLGRDGASAQELQGPIEVLVEREPPPALDAAFAVEASLQFLRLLAARGLGAARTAFLADPELQLDVGAWSARGHLEPASRAYLELMAGRALDGALLFERLHAAVAAGALPEPPLADAAAVLEVARGWLGWVEEFQGAATAGTAFQPERLEHAFAVSAQIGAEPRVLGCHEYPGDSVDWYDFELEPGAVMPVVPKPVTVASRTFIPAPVAYPGMPAARWWQFEDANVNLAQLDMAPEDLARFFVVEFATVYANDWYILPIELPIGSISRVTSLEVRDTFTDVIGQPTVIQIAGAQDPDAAWRLFRLSHKDDPARAGNELFLAPTLVTPLESAALEDVQFGRDEDANVCWAIERCVSDTAGLPYERRRGPVPLAAQPPPSRDDMKQPLAYELMSPVPENWYPLLLRSSAEGRMLWLDTHEKQPIGSVLGAVPFRLFDEEVSRAGLQVTRTAQHARWVDGSTWLWTGRRKRPGCGEPSSGLRFDAVRRPGERRLP
ncbi:MAG TPA: hypothetical protein VLC53_20655 [Myxococcota bacterium]|nr:hypothetical protein [Myxococcota bacterium]